VPSNGLSLDSCQMVDVSTQYEVSVVASAAMSCSGDAKDFQRLKTSGSGLGQAPNMLACISCGLAWFKPLDM